MADNVFHRARKLLESLGRTPLKDFKENGVSRTEARRTRRVEAIRSLAPDWRCMKCKRFVSNIDSWILSIANETAFCRGCIGVKFPGRGKHLRVNIFEDEPRYEIDGAGIRRARLSSSKTSFEVASLCSWAPAYQSKLETGKVKTLSGDVALKLFSVLRDSRFATPSGRYLIKATQLSRAREAAGLTKSQFARRCGWTLTRQSALESGEVQTVSSEVRNCILVVLKERSVFVNDGM